MTDTLSHRRIFGVLLPSFNTAMQPELDDLRPPGVSNQTGRFNLDENVLENVAVAARDLNSCGPDGLIIGLFQGCTS